MESGFSRGYTRVARICATFPLRKIGLAHANLEDWKFRRAWFLRNQPPSWKGEIVSRVGDTWTTRRPFGAAAWARKRTIRNRTRRCEIFRLSTKAKAPGTLPSMIFNALKLENFRHSCPDILIGNCFRAFRRIITARRDHRPSSST